MNILKTKLCEFEYWSQFFVCFVSHVRDYKIRHCKRKTAIESKKKKTNKITKCYVNCVRMRKLFTR